MRALAAALGLLALTAVDAQPASAARPTGRYLVTFEKSRTATSSAALRAVLARTGVTRAGRGVPALRIATVRGPAAAIARLRRDPTVRSVSVEWERDLRRMPNDPALIQPETEFTNGVPAGTPIQWALARQNFPAAWDVTTGDGAVVGVIDSGVDGSSSELRSKIASADAVGTTNALTDPDGHGTHTSGLACAATDNGIGVAGAGFNCRLAVIKFAEQPVSGAVRDEDIVDGIRVAAQRGVDSINMSFGGGETNAALRQAVDFAVSKGVVLVASASNDPTQDQGAPAVELQAGTAPDINAGKGLVVTAADFSDTRAGTGLGPGVSMAAYGFFDDGDLGPPGLVSTYPAARTPREGATPLDGCDCRKSINGNGAFAYLQGTSMAAPQVAGLAALVSDLNPFLTLPDKLTLIKQTARRSGGWTPDLGWGILDAGRAVDAARRLDRSPPTSKARAKKRVKRRKGARRARLRLRWRSSDPAGAPRLIASGLRDQDVYMKKGRGRYRRIRRSTRRKSALLKLRPGVYRFYTRARDRAGNREPKPHRADVRVVVAKKRR
jgi:serine protease